MKITIYELLGMIKDGKAPKNVKSEGHYYTYNEIEKDYYEGMGYDYEYLIKNTSNDRLNDEVEILEEEKKIPEKLYKYMEKEEEGCYENILRVYDGGEYEINEDMSFVIDKINSIIDYLKSKGE